MGYNKSLDFLNMIKNGSALSEKGKKKAASGDITSHDTAPACGLIAVIDTETNWRDEVMSLGVAIADSNSFRCIETRYYIFEPECRVGGIYSGVMYKCSTRPVECMRDEALADLVALLKERGISRIFAYNAKFDLGHLPELGDFEWYDIMRIAAYRQYNRAIPESAECYKTGRLRTNYGVEPITRMLTGDSSYREVHNAVEDAVDELRIVELLGISLDEYECARI